MIEGETLTRNSIDPVQNFTKPPARFSEATLVKELESKGIGRPKHVRRHHGHHPKQRLCPHPRKTISPIRAGYDRCRYSG